MKRFSLGFVITSLLAIFLLVLTPSVDAENSHRYMNLKKYFVGYKGTFLLYDLKKDQYTIYNQKKSEKRVAPNSTFKIPHALFALDQGIVKNGDTLFPWDGTVYPIDSWNQDTTLSMAIQNSTIWYFQEIADRLGEKNEKRYLDRINYGNKDISGGLQSFWLQSSLKISPIEQLIFMKKFYTYDLPFSKKHIDLLKNILVQEQRDGAILSGKTGTGWHNNELDGIPVNGWYVGYVEQDENAYIFVTNIEADQGASGSKAKEITLEILRDKGIYR